MRQKSPYQTFAARVLEKLRGPLLFMLARAGWLAAARGAKRAWWPTSGLIRGWRELAATATMMWGCRANRLLQLLSQWRALPPKTPLALFLVAVVLVGVHHDTGVTAGDYSFIAVQAMLGLSSPSKFLYRTSEAKAAIGCGTSKLYSLINSGVLEARRFGHRTYITGASLEAFVASLPRVVTPTMAKAGPGRWSGRNPPAAIQKDGAERDRWPGRGNPRSDLEEDAAE
jgi:hypothetical protein